MKINSVKKPTLDEKIAYALTDRKILHFRYDAHLRREVFKRLNHTQRNLLNRLSSAGVEALQKRELDKLLRELKKEIAQTYQELTAYTDTELSGFLMSETTALQHLYNDSVGFDFFNTVPDYKLKATQRVSLIAGAPLEEWWKKQGNETAFRFENLLRQGLLDGKQTHELVSDVKDLMNTSRRHAETLVITAVAKTADDAHQSLRDENLDLIKGEKHLATLDTRTSEVCRVRDGLMWDIDKKPIDHDLPYRRPPLHPRCRSILQFVLKSWKELGFDNVDEIPESTRASMDGQVGENINYENWLKGKSQAEQDAVLGKGKADLWRRGVITFRDMLDQSGRPLTLKQLSALNVGNRWKQHVMQSSLDSELPKNLSDISALGNRIFNKYNNIMQKAIEDEKAHEGILEILRQEGVELEGIAKVTSFEQRAISEATEALKRYPKHWVEKANEVGMTYISESPERAHQYYVGERTNDIQRKNAIKPKIWKRFFKKNTVQTGDSLIVSDIDPKHTSEAYRISTFVHEYGHRLQRVLPELDRYFTEFWEARTKGLPIERLSALTGNKDYGAEVAIKDHLPNPYYGKIYREFGKMLPLEMFTMTFESLLGGNHHQFMELYAKDRELFNFGLALLTRYKP